MYSTTRNDVKQIALNIETLAKELQNKLDKGEDFIMVCNELVRNTATMTFTIGEVYAIEQTGAGKKVASTVVKAPTVKNANYHNLRDSSGRFRKV